MERIGKNHNLIKMIREMNKSNPYEDLIASDDLEVLKVVLKYNLEIPYLLYSFEQNYQVDTLDLLNQLKLRAQACFEISNHVYEGIKQKDNHAGILAVIRLPQFKLEDLGDFIIVLDHLEIPGNVGTIYRTLDACGASGVIFIDAITKRNNLKLASSARGTNLILPTVNSTYKDTLTFLLDHQYTIYLGEPKLGHNYKEYDYQGKIAIVVGNERFGIQEDWYKHPHQKVYIPMKGNNNSLNVGVATSILAYEAATKRNEFK